jgi:hypothetical protein
VSDVQSLEAAQWRAGFTLYPETSEIMPASLSHLKGSVAAPQLLDSLRWAVQALLDARTEAVALRATEENLRARIAALEAWPTDAQCDAITVGVVTEWETLNTMDDVDFAAMRAIIRAALARPTTEGA